MKGKKVGHSKKCQGGECRGGCLKNKDNFFVVTGERQQGKTLSQIQMAMAQDPKVFKFPVLDENLNLWKQYEEKKTSLIKPNQERNNWETLGRILGMAYAAGDDEFDAFLEGFYTGHLNESSGRRAMGGKRGD